MKKPGICRLSRRIACGVLAIGLGTASAPAHADEVVVFAASSLATALSEIKPLFENETAHTVVLSLAGSSALARQIQHGAPADIFLSASPGWMDMLEAQNLIEPGTRRDLLGNALVLIAHDPGAAAVDLSVDLDLAGLLGDRHLAMALVDAVPAGIYGKAALTYLGQWQSVEAKVVQSNNVRAALALVALGEAPYGIVYATDALAEPRVHVVGRFPARSHPPIVYPVADLAHRETAGEAAFLDFLDGPVAREVFTRNGFAVIAP